MKRCQKILICVAAAPQSPQRANGFGGDSCCGATADESQLRVLGRVETPFPGKSVRSQEPRLSQAAIAAISGLAPTMFMTRVRL